MSSTQFHPGHPSPFLGLALRELAENWWLLLLRGIAAIAFGVLAFTWPGLTLLTLTLMWGFYAIADGILADIELQAPAVLLNVDEPGLAHAADGLNAPGDLHARLIGDLLRGLGSVFRKNLRDGDPVLLIVEEGPRRPLVLSAQRVGDCCDDAMSRYRNAVECPAASSISEARNAFYI